MRREGGVRVVFDPEIDRGGWPGVLGERSAVAGEMWLGPMGLLGRLEVELGLGATWATVIGTTAGYAIIDHKSFPGMDAAALDRARAFSGQLAAYAGAIRAATAAPVISLWILFHILGRLVELRPAGQPSTPPSIPAMEAS